MAFTVFAVLPMRMTTFGAFLRRLLDLSFTLTLPVPEKRLVLPAALAVPVSLEVLPAGGT